MGEGGRQAKRGAGVCGRGGGGGGGGGGVWACRTQGHAGGAAPLVLLKVLTQGNGSFNFKIVSQPDVQHESVNLKRFNKVFVYHLEICLYSLVNNPI